MSRAGPEEFTGVRAVTFDLFDTLARFWPPREQIQAQALQAFAIEVTPEGIDRGYALADAYMARENASGVPVRMRPPEATAAFFAEYERLVLHGAGVEVSRETAWRVWQEVRKIRYDLALFDDVLPSLRRLKELGLALGLISNINRTGPDLLQSLGLDGGAGLRHHLPRGGSREAPRAHLPGGATAVGDDARRGGPRGRPVRFGHRGGAGRGHAGRAHRPVRDR